MKKRKILALGLLTALLVVGLGSLQGYAIGHGVHACVILTDRGHCPTGATGVRCYVDPGNWQEDCDFCCYDAASPCREPDVENVIDRYGCGCCYLY